jgi:CheY-like chemotaxis protein
MNDQAAKLFVGQTGVCAVLLDVLIDKGIVSQREFFERFQRAAGRWSGGCGAVEPATAPDRLDGQTVLLVEGDPAAADRLQAALEDAGAEVLVVRNTAEALSRMAQFDFSAAVLDWRPETREHRAATRWLREDGVRILFHAAQPPEDAIAACGDPVLVKPAPPDAMVRALARLTGFVGADGRTGAA